ncbi:protein mono-ADP-ribosyltransferase PARP15-like, partial [Actinia tenebrosa]|uniref:Poly [ADP-ribose] polymerase n=1 Tax=Actinia tenebrosa TaxID=6105 RepID=A0A6P8HMS1_ACTTE
MIEKNLDTGDTARVERRDKTAGVPLPAHWDPQPTDSDGKELDLHMVVLDPVKHKKEYDDVKGAIEKTTSVNISKIERVQNPGLYSTYAVKKQKMDDQNRSNEKKLFHGTAAATCQLINHQGFNRSFCGKN